MVNGECQMPARPADKSQMHLSAYQCEAKSQFESEPGHESDILTESVVSRPWLGLQQWGLLFLLVVIILALLREI